MKILLTAFLFLFYLSACGGGSSATTPIERVTFTGAGDLGIFDPSVTRDTNSGLLWMSYSSVSTSPNYASTLYWSVSIRLAFSDDNGVTWQDAGVAVSPVVERTDFGPMTEAHPTGDIPANTKGMWQSEMSTLIYDPNPANPNESWKLIWIHYFHGDATSYFVDYSWVSMKMAATPAGLEAAPAVKLFGGVGLQADNSIAGPPVYAPIGGAPLIQLNTDIPPVMDGEDVTELNSCIFAEPGLHATNSAIYMTIYCADASTIPLTEYIVHFRCNSPCTITNAASWEYLGRLLSPTDAQAATSDHHYQAPALAEKNGKTYLTVTPVDTTSGDRYNGCRVYEFVDVNSNFLRRNAGQLIEVGRIDGDVNSHNGACAAFNGLDGGILLSQFGIAGTADAFKIIKSQVSLP